MKKICFLVIGLLLFGCKKSAPSGTSGASNGLVSSIVLYNPLGHILNIQTFTYNGALLTNYVDQTIDSTNMGIDREVRTFSFSYGGSALPVSSTFTDSTLYGSNLVLDGAAPYNLVYDDQSRLIIDSSSVSYGGYSPSTFYHYAGDSISVFNSNQGAPNYPAGVMTITNGNLTKSGAEMITYGTNLNPLYNSAIGKSFAPYFYYGLIGVHLQSYAIPVDFISRNLPSGGGNGSNQVSFNWTAGANGRIVSGTASNLYPYSPAINGTVQITFHYF